MKLWKAYIKERTGAEIFDSADGFAVYYITNKECFIEDFYIVPEKRLKGEARAMMDAVGERAKKSGCTHLTANADINTKGADIALISMLHYGFKPISANANMIGLIKEIV